MIDLHAHTTASDGQHAPSELVALAKAAGVTCLSVTDHDTVAGLAEAQAAAALHGLTLVPGIEVSTEVAGIDIHVLGHFVRPEDAALRRYAHHQEGERRRRMERMVGKLNDLGIPVRMSHVEAEAGSENLCRPHLARALVRLGYSRDVQDAFDRYIGEGRPAFAAQERLPAREAIGLIHQAGGTATIAHPALDGLERFHIGLLKEAGLDGVEAFHPDHNPSMREKYLAIARDLDLVPTAGSDFHGADVARPHRLGAHPMPPEHFEALRARAGAGR